jgi:hypothetical protein
MWGVAVLPCPNKTSSVPFCQQLVRKSLEKIYEAVSRHSSINQSCLPFVSPLLISVVFIDFSFCSFCLFVFFYPILSLFLKLNSVSSIQPSFALFVSSTHHPPIPLMAILVSRLSFVQMLRLSPTVGPCSMPQSPHPDKVTVQERGKASLASNDVLCGTTTMDSLVWLQATASTGVDSELVSNEIGEKKRQLEEHSEQTI